MQLSKNVMSFDFFLGYEAMTAQQCPVVKWKITRSNAREKFAVVYKCR